jgi:sulfatase maturation enzyme AslB (radical SAM superfamily)
MLGQRPLGNIHTLADKNLLKVWNDSRLSTIRKEMLEGKQPQECSACYSLESLKGQSERIFLNERLKKHAPVTKQTQNNGNLLQLPKVLSLRLSNVCNLKCRMCSSLCSTSWYEDDRKRGQSTPNGPLKIYNSIAELERSLGPLLDDLVEINFAGGEPLLIEEHYHLLDLLIKRQKTDIALTYNSNLTKLNLGDRNILDYWRHFSSITLEVSLDHVGSRGEYIRHGMTWDKVRASIKACLAQGNVNMFFSPVIQIYNALSYPSLIKTLMAEFDTTSLKINPIALTSPEYLSLQVLPEELKKEVSDNWMKLKRELIALEGVEQSAFHRAQLTAIEDFMNKKDLSKLLPRFVSTTIELDQLRGECAQKTFPELSSLFL